MRSPRSPRRRDAPNAPSSGTSRKCAPGCASSSTGKRTMKPSPPDPLSRTLDDFVAAFEEALAQDDQPDLNDFLPRVGHPLRDKVLSELIRVELEYGWEKGRPRPLAEYRQRFPDFFHDP